MSERKPRILVFEFHQETNDFNPITTPFARFQPKKIFEGEERFREVVGNRGMACGCVEGVRDAGGEVIPAVFMHAPSGGRVDDEVFDYLTERLQYYIAQAGEIDGVVAALHGCTACVSHDDACGELLEMLRGLVGDKVIAAAFDLHANITDKILRNTDVICGYNTYPHLDYYTTGYRAAKLGMEMLAGKKLFKAAAEVAILIPPSGYNNRTGPFKEIIDAGNAMVEEGRIRDYTVFPVQPWLDVADIRSCVVTEGEDPEEAKRCADELAKMLFDMRDDAMPQLYSVDEIIDAAEKNDTGKPVLMAESADSPNGGCVGDSPVVAMRLQERGSQLKTCMFVVDPKAVEHAFRVGVGGTAEFSVGAGFTPGMPGPFKAVGTVQSLHDGYFPTSKYAVSYLGQSAVVSFGNIDILLCHQGATSGSPMIFRNFGMEPAFYDLVVVKANTSFRAPYAPVSEIVYVADTVGAGAANLKRFSWKKLPAGMHPFDLPEGYEPPKAKLW